MIQAVKVSKFCNNETVIADFNIKIERNDVLAITGESGKGKTTILNRLCLLEKPRIINKGMKF